MEDWDYKKTWYHGSPLELTTLRKGSTITQDKDLARIFSHKPTIVSCLDNNFFGHNGKKPGFLYYVAEYITSEDVYPHPNSSMKAGKEWLTYRELKLKLICKTEVIQDEKLSQKDIDWLKSNF